MHANFGRAALGGFVGTLVMTAMMYIVAPMMGGGLFSSAMGGRHDSGDRFAHLMTT